ncbi:hypothetical protein Emin_0322 [Elusimicrobium minutum Pei191]|uniref:Uncharacterized protein n=1 Tax=Elusimicrobium minutum (strain Pei191) TaxID=445932 RepID=B2KBX7_ELUMP|nr:hypothetical protein [Elusimicrobium minutum]ACC97881.1 hypothetical protein Emin_0322 [Elusimicrobium minutum Pei191]
MRKFFILFILPLMLVCARAGVEEDLDIKIPRNIKDEKIKLKEKILEQVKRSDTGITVTINDAFDPDLSEQHGVFLKAEPIISGSLHNGKVKAITGIDIKDRALLIDFTVLGAQEDKKQKQIGNFNPKKYKKEDKEITLYLPAKYRFKQYTENTNDGNVIFYEKTSSESLRVDITYETDSSKIAKPLITIINDAALNGANPLLILNNILPNHPDFKYLKDIIPAKKEDEANPIVIYKTVSKNTVTLTYFIFG